MDKKEREAHSTELRNSTAMRGGPADAYKRKIFDIVYNAEFARVKKGYSISQVNEFCKDIAREIETGKADPAHVRDTVFGIEKPGYKPIDVDIFMNILVHILDHGLM